MSFVCKECNREFASEESLNQHNYSKHRVITEKKESKSMKKFVWIIIFVVLIVGAYFSYSYYQKLPGKYDDFVKCLGEKGAKFYGAYWCPNCNDQKRVFGKSAKYLPYVECSTPDGKEQLQNCKDTNIEAYPTWIFSDGTRMTGTTSKEELAAKTGCEL